MRRSSGSALATALLALVLASGCDKAAQVDGAAATAQPLRAAGTTNLFEQIAAAPEHTPFAGTRRWRVRVEEDGVPRDSEYVERVVADGRGGFAITPVELVQPVLRGDQLQLFELMQKGREAFLYRYRDVRVRDVALALQNYHVRAVRDGVSVAGRSCDVVELDKSTEPQTHYLLAVDHVTRLVLRSEEFSATGQLVARMEFESFDAQPDLTGVALHVDLPATELDPDTANMTELGFRLNRPSVLHGFRLARAEGLELGGRKWARLLYHDGIEPLFFLQGGPAASTGSPQPAPTGPLNGLPVVRIFHSGSWTIASCVRDGYDFIVAGKLSEADLLTTLQSAIE